MGSEFGQERAWDPTRELDWHALEDQRHRQVASAVRDLGELYRRTTSLHADDSDHTGFRWLDPDDAQRCVISYMRVNGDAFAIVVLNFAAVNYEEYVVGVPQRGAYQVAFDSDAAVYGGGGATRMRRAESADNPSMGLSHSLALALPALSGVVITLA